MIFRQATRWVLIMISWLVLACTTIKPATESMMSENNMDVFSHAGFDLVLQRFVDESGRIDYAALKKDPQELEDYYQLIAAYSPDSHPDLFPTDDQNGRVSVGHVHGIGDGDAVWELRRDQRGIKHQRNRADRCGVISLAQVDLRRHGRVIGQHAVQTGKGVQLKTVDSDKGHGISSRVVHQVLDFIQLISRCQVQGL